MSQEIFSHSTFGQKHSGTASNENEKDQTVVTVYQRRFTKIIIISLENFVLIAMIFLSSDLITFNDLKMYINSGILLFIDKVFLFFLTPIGV